MSKQALKQAIVSAFQSQIDANNQDAAYQAIATQISDAVELYVQSELNALKAVLVTPGTFIGAGVPPTAVTAPGLATYSPGIP